MEEKRENPRSSPPPGHKPPRRRLRKASADHTISKQQRSSSCNSTIFLPPYVWDIIFIFLPAKYLIRFRAVCKAWLSIIDNPFFVKAHIDKQQRSSCNTILIRTSTGPPFAPFYSVDLDALGPIPATPADLPRTILQDLPVATCHGLIFVTDENFEIWNPLFGDRLKLPRRGLNLDHHRAVKGLGYDHATDDYKAVVLAIPHYYEDKTLAFVYSLRSDSWRRIMDCPWPCDWGVVGGPGVYLSGALHWLSRGDSDIIALNLETEKFQKLQRPLFRESRELERVKESKRHLDVLDGCLVVTEYKMYKYKHDHKVNFDAWVLKGGSWIKLFSLGHYGHHLIRSSLRPVAYMKNKRHILMKDHENFCVVDAVTDSMKMVYIRGFNGEFVSAQLFQESLVRPNYICGVDGQRRKKRENKSKNKGMMEKCKTELYFSVSDLG